VQNKHSKQSFTLVEIMIVVAIIILIASIGIPSLLRSRHNANEAAAMSACRAISTACESYIAVQGVYPYNLTTLGDEIPPYIDETLASGEKHGYNFSYQRLSTYTYACTADPTDPGVTGTRTFVINQTGVIQTIDNSS